MLLRGVPCRFGGTALKIVVWRSLLRLGRDGIIARHMVVVVVVCSVVVVRVVCCAVFRSSYDIF